MDTEENVNRTQVQLTDVATKETRPLVEATGTTHPSWSPDGRHVAFLARPESPKANEGPGPAVDILEGAQLMVVPADGGEPWQHTNLLTGAGAPNWSPEGDQIAFTTMVKPSEGLEFIRDNVVDKDQDLYVYFNQDVLVLTRIKWKSDAAGFLGNHRQQIATVAFDPKNWGEAVEPQLLTLGDYDLSSPTWSPDGERLAVLGNTDPDNERVWDTYLYTISARADQPSEPQKVFGMETMSSTVAWSPDGSAIVLSGHNDPVLGNAAVQKLWLVCPNTGEAECLTEDFEHPFGDYSRNYDLRGYGGMLHGDDNPKWSPDSSELLVLVNEEGTVHLARVSRADGTVEKLTEGVMSINTFSVDASFEKVAVTMEDDTKPNDLYLVDLEGEAPLHLQRLTEVNEAILSRVDLTSPERFKVPVGERFTIDTWLIPPVDREPGKKYPVILYAGGGPGGMRASVFCHEFHMYAAQGYAVLHCNARGNYGYGEDFATAPDGAWGDMDVEDNMVALRAALDRYEWLDPERLAVAGGSYGGYTTSILTTRYPDTFNAAVVDRCVCNNYSSHGTGDMGHLLNLAKFDNKHPWEAPDEYLDASPIHHIANVETPTLVIHSAQDYRCSVEQGEQLYTALQLMEVPTKLIRFSNENHGLCRAGRPWHRVFRLNGYLDWFEQWV
jgi:dipeptidyl aminopeptidase/acylaminoacyl peptidase